MYPGLTGCFGSQKPLFGWPCQDDQVLVWIPVATYRPGLYTHSHPLAFFAALLANLITPSWLEQLLDLHRYRMSGNICPCFHKHEPDDNQFIEFCHCNSIVISGAMFPSSMLIFDLLQLTYHTQTKWLPKNVSKWKTGRILMSQDEIRDSSQTFPTSTAFPSTLFFMNSFFIPWNKVCATHHFHRQPQPQHRCRVKSGRQKPELFTRSCAAKSHIHRE